MRAWPAHSLAASSCSAQATAITAISTIVERARKQAYELLDNNGNAETMAASRSHLSSVIKFVEGAPKMSKPVAAAKEASEHASEWPTEGDEEEVEGSDAKEGADNHHEGSGAEAPEAEAGAEVGAEAGADAEDEESG